MAIYSFLDLAADVLKVASQPLTYQEVRGSKAADAFFGCSIA